MIIISAKCGRRVAKISQMGGCFGGLEAEPPAAGGYWGSEGKAPSRRKRLKFWHFFKNNLILGLY